MAVLGFYKLHFALLFGVAFVLALLLPAAHSLSPAQPPAASYGTSIDQGVAYVLMLLALALTYIIHSADLSISF